MNYLPPRRFKPQSLPKKRTRPRRSSAIKCRGHLVWVKTEWGCSIEGLVCKVTGVRHDCVGPIDPDHITTRGAGGGDEQVWPLCRCAHDLRGSLGLPEFQRRYGTNAEETGAELWQLSPPGRAYRIKQGKD